MRHTDPSSSSTRRRRLIAAAAALVAATAVVLVLALAGGSSGPGGGLGAADAVAQAADRTGVVRSGVMTTVADVAGRQTTAIVRFDGDDAEAVFDDPAGGERRTIRVVAGQGYQRTGDGPWSVMEGESGTPVIDQLRAEIDNDALVDAVRSADQVAQDGDTYRAVLTAEQLAALDRVPLGLSETPPAEGATVVVAVGEDGLLRGVTLDAGTIQQTVTYTELGEPQGLEAPATG